MQTWLVAALAVLVAGCVPVDRDAARDVIGVSAVTDMAAGDAVAHELLVWKASQICTVPGYDVQKKGCRAGRGRRTDRRLAIAVPAVHGDDTDPVLT